MKTKTFKFMSVKVITVVELSGKEAIFHIDCAVTHLSMAEAKAYAETILAAVKYAEEKGLK